MLENENKILLEAQQKVKDKKISAKEQEKKAKEFNRYEIEVLKGKLVIVEEIKLVAGGNIDKNTGLYLGQNIEGTVWASKDVEGNFIGGSEERVGLIRYLGDGISKEEFQIGDGIMYFNYNGWDIKNDGESLRVIKYDDIIAKIGLHKDHTFVSMADELNKNLLTDGK